MKIAIFFKNDNLRAFHDKGIEILVFQIINNQVVGVESLIPNSDKSEDRLQFLKSKGINGIYLLEIEEECRENLQRNNIEVMTGKMLSNDKLFNSLYFSNLNIGN